LRFFFTPALAGGASPTLVQPGIRTSWVNEAVEDIPVLSARNMSFERIEGGGGEDLPRRF